MLNIDHKNTALIDYLWGAYRCKIDRWIDRNTFRYIDSNAKIYKMYLHSLVHAFLKVIDIRKWFVQCSSYKNILEAWDIIGYNDPFCPSIGWSGALSVLMVKH